MFQYRQWCAEVDEGDITPELQQKIFADSFISSEKRCDANPPDFDSQYPQTSGLGGKT